MKKIKRKNFKILRFLYDIVFIKNVLGDRVGISSMLYLSSNKFKVVIYALIVGTLNLTVFSFLWLVLLYFFSSINVSL